MPRRLLLVLMTVAAASVGVFYLRYDTRPSHYTGFVEGEERVLRSEVSGRVLEVHYAEGATIPPNEPMATLDDRDIQARLASKRQELAVLDAQLDGQTERIALAETTWKRKVSAHTAALQQAESVADLAVRTLAREETLEKNGISTAQSLDDHRARRDQARGALDRARELLAGVEAEERAISVARHELLTLHRQRDLLVAQLAELQVVQSKYVIRAPGVATVLQTQFIWPGELAQPGTAVASVIDPADKYVQIYVPVIDVDRLRIGQRVTIELDSQLGYRVPGEISFVADTANFTPEKIETRSDRMGQVYRAKVRILEGVERFQPGTEGDVYLDS